MLETLHTCGSQGPALHRQDLYNKQEKLCTDSYQPSSLHHQEPPPHVPSTWMVEKRPEHQPGRNEDEDFVRRDMPNAEMWYRSTIGTVRQLEQGSHGTIGDRSINGEEPTKLYIHRFGLQLTLTVVRHAC